MAQRIGADMLAHLDNQLAAGRITPAEHRAREAEVLELIRTGRDVDMGGGERASRGVYAALVGLFGVLAGVGCMAGLPLLLGLPVGIAFIVVGILLGRRVRHPRIR